MTFGVDTISKEQLRNDEMYRGAFGCPLSRGLPGPRLLLTENHFKTP